MPLYVGLFTSHEGDEGVEPDDPAYARQEVVFGPHGSNTDALSYGKVTREHTLTELGIFDRKQGGHLLYSGPLTHSPHVLPGDHLSFAVGYITVSVFAAIPAQAVPVYRPTAWERILGTTSLV
jgi:hypothetical protein